MAHLSEQSAHEGASAGAEALRGRDFEGANLALDELFVGERRPGRAARHHFVGEHAERPPAKKLITPSIQKNIQRRRYHMSWHVTEKAQ